MPFDRLHADDRDALHAALAADEPGCHELTCRCQHDERGEIVLRLTARSGRRSADRCDWQLTITDLTEQRRHELALGKLLAQVPGLIYQFMRTPDGSYTLPFVSGSFFGIDAAAIQMDFSIVLDRIHPDDRSKVLTSIEASARDLTLWDCDYRFESAAGQIWVHGRSTPERLADGSVLWHGFITDISERKRAAERLVAALAAAKEASEAKSRFLANMSHEIRTPMNGVLGMLHLLREAGLPDGAAEQADLAYRSAESLLRVLGDILDYARLESGRLDLRREPYDLVSVVREAATLFQHPAQDAGIDLTIDAPVSCPMVGDPGRVRQILVNLVGNAVKFCEVGTVQIRVRESDREVLVGVHDTGVGIAPDVLARLFAPFVQGDDSTSRRYGGTGMGLAVSCRLAAHMGGRIDAVSQEGQGSTFTLVLPVPPGRGSDARRAMAAAAVAAAAGHLPPPRQLRILVVEDDRMNMQTACMFIERLGSHAVSADDGQGALDRLCHGGIDLVLMDVQLPGMDGLEATSRWRRHEAEHGLRRLPIIALTANAFPKDRERCIAAGMDGFLAKPTTLASLRDAINAVFDV